MLGLDCTHLNKWYLVPSSLGSQLTLGEIELELLCLIHS